MSGFAYVTTACFGDSVFTPINFSVTWESLNRQGRSVVPFLQSKALMYFPHFYSDKFYKGSQIEEKCRVGLLPNHSAKTTQSPATESPQHLSAEPPVFLDFFNITSLPPSIFPPGRGLVTCSASKSNSDSRPVLEIREPGETYLNSSALPEDVDGASGCCWYQSSGSLWRSGEGSKSTLGCFLSHHNSGLKKIHNLKVLS